MTTELKAIRFKAKAEPDGSFSGKASVYGIVDAYGDVVMPGAFTQTIADHNGRILVLAQHDPSDVIGMATLIDKPDALYVEGTLELALPSAKDMHVRMKAGLVTGISIGYETVDATYNKGVRELRAVKLWEVSLVTFGANPAALLTSVKKRNPDRKFAEPRSREQSFVLESLRLLTRQLAGWNTVIRNTK